MQDVDALGWRLAAVVKGAQPAAILAGYDRERVFGADENLLNSSRSTRFMSPEPGVERLFRDAVLHLASRVDFARPMVNSGRLSRPCTYPLIAPDADLPEGARPGAVAPDAPLGKAWLLDTLGRDFVVLALGQPAPKVDGARSLQPEMNDQLQRRYLGTAERAIYLIRPDQVVAARWITASSEDISAALSAAWGA